METIKERPILFSGAMVRALLAGTKTQTRRVCKSQPYSNGFHFDGHDILCHNDYLPPSAMLMDCRRGGIDYTTSDHEGWTSECPYGQPGERLWVRETTHRRPMLNLLTGEPLDPKYDGGAYTADGDYVLNPEGFDVAWWYSRKSCPAIHMPRWASRILLEITAVRVERLQDISEDDALAEGIVQLRDGGFGLPAGEHYHYTDPRQSYLSLWEAINGPGSVEANPWAWAVTFRRLP